MFPYVFLNCFLKFHGFFQISYKPLRGHFHISRFFGNLFVALLDWIGGSGVSSAVVKIARS